MYSFLYPFERKLGDISNSINDLHLNEIIDYISKDKLENDFIYEILSDFETNEKNIYYRQNLIKDFLKFPRLYDDLKVFFDRFSSLDYMYKNVKKEIITMSKPFKSFNVDRYEYSGEILRRYANLILDLFRCYKDLNKCLESYAFDSEALSNFKLEITKRVTNDAFNEMVSLMKEVILNSGNYKINVFIDEKIRTINASIVFGYQREALPKSFLKKKINKKDLMLDLTSRSYFEFDYFLSLSSIKAINIITDIYEDYYGVVSQGSKALMFVNFALKYKALLDELHLPCSFPSFGSDYNIKDLYDPYLGLKAKLDLNKIITIYPNNLVISKEDGSVLVIGENNTGKTVFTRSLGINQIFAQAGLFSSSVSSVLSLRSKLVTCYASKESHMGDGGRFETEVRALSKIFEEADEKTLVIINEIFQSTSTIEGTKALFDVLCFLTSKNILSICVSHFLDLQYEKKNFSKETKKNLKLMRTTIVNGVHKIDEIND